MILWLRESDAFLVAAHVRVRRCNYPAVGEEVVTSYRADIVESWHSPHPRLFLVQINPASPRSVLCEDGTWKDVPDGEAAPSDAGLTIPREAVEALRDAAIRFSGLPEDRELSSTREALALERERVDRVLGAFLDQA